MSSYTRLSYKEAQSIPNLMSAPDSPILWRDGTYLPPKQRSTNLSVLARLSVLKTYAHQLGILPKTMLRLVLAQVCPEETLPAGQSDSSSLLSPAR